MLPARYGRYSSVCMPPRSRPDLLCQDEFKAEAEAVRTTIDELKARLSATCSSNCRNWIAVIAPLRHRRKGESTGGYATGANISLMVGVPWARTSVPMACAKAVIVPGVTFYNPTSEM